jgi:hypothetical protein
MEYSVKLLGLCERALAAFMRAMRFLRLVIIEEFGRIARVLIELIDTVSFFLAFLAGFCVGVMRDIGSFLLR